MMSSPNNSHTNILLQLFSPSWLSGFLAVAAGLLASAGVIAVFSLSTSEVQQQLLTWQHSQPTRALTTPDQILEQNDKPTLSGSWPLLLFWSGLGLFVYFAATGLAKSLSNAAALRESLDYVNVKKQSLLASAAELFVFKIVIAGLWIGFSVMFFKKIIPYSITASHASAADFLSLTGIEYALIAFLVIALSVQAHAVFARLLVGRIRLFS